MNLLTIGAIIFTPHELFERLADSKPSLKQVVWQYVLWLGIIPPLCAYFGVSLFGWHFGFGEPVNIDNQTALFIAVAYYICLLVGYVLTTFLMHWMAPTYGASTHLGLHAALTAIVGTPLMLGGVMHLYPLLPLNLLALIPVVIWSMYLLYTGVPSMLGTDQARGMLLASAILGVYFVAVVALVTLIAILWVNGIGPDIGFDWRLSVEG